MQKPETPDGLFHVGNPLTGEKGTPITADWLNALLAIGALFTGPANPPGPEIGDDGDHYLNAAAQLIFGPKAGGAWPAGVSIKGATGATGPAGNPYKAYATLAAANADFANIPDNSLIFVNDDGLNHGYWSKIGGVLAQSGSDRVTLLEALTADGAFPNKKLKGNAPTANIFDISTVLTGYKCTGVAGPYVSANDSLSDFIPVIGSAQYIISSATSFFAVYYTAAKVFISASAAVTANDHIFLVPATAAFMRLNIPTAKLPNFMAMAGATLPATYVKYGVSLGWLVLEDGAVGKRHCDTEIQGMLDSVTPQRVLGNAMTANLINYRNVTPGYVITTGAGPTANAAFSLSEYIPVVAGASYVLSTAFGIYISYFDAAKRYLSSAPSVGGNVVNQGCVAPANATYCRLNLQNSILTTYMMVAGAVMPKSFMPFGTALEWLLPNKTKTARWLGKVFVTFGDSITWYDGNNFLNTHTEYNTKAIGYQSYMREGLQCRVNNAGVSSKTMPEILAIIQAYDFTLIDAVTITSGANDFRNVLIGLGAVQPIGSAFDTATYTGAMQAAIEHILAQNPLIKIYLLAPVKGWANGFGIMPVTYPDAMKAVGALYSLPVCDWYGLSGINEITKPVLIGDLEANTYYLHPTNAGYERMGELIVPFLANN